jgi:hypothetical protein
MPRPGMTPPGVHGFVPIPRAREVYPAPPGFALVPPPPPLPPPHLSALQHAAAAVHAAAPGPSGRLKRHYFVAPIRDLQGTGEQEIIRWGDQQTFQFSEGGTQNTSGQLVKVHRKFPEDFDLLIFASNTPDPAGTHDVSGTFQITIGVGSAQVQFLFFFHWDPAALVVTEDYTSITVPALNTNYNIVWKRIEFPVKDLQVSATFSVNAVGPVAGLIQVAAFAAPRVFQPSPAQQPPPASEDTSGDQTTEWMPPGFSPEPVHYK